MLNLPGKCKYKIRRLAERNTQIRTSNEQVRKTTETSDETIKYLAQRLIQYPLLNEPGKWTGV